TGFASATSGQSFGGSFQSNSTTGTGVQGQGATGVSGISVTDGGVAVLGTAQSPLNATTATWGGVFVNQDATGLGGGIKGTAQRSGAGVGGMAPPPAICTPGTQCLGVWSQGNARVDGNLTVSGTVSKGGGAFKIDHPLDPANKYLSHSFVESPDM